MFQSLDWVDVDFDRKPSLRPPCVLYEFQSLDWVDVDFDIAPSRLIAWPRSCFNPSTGLMLISTSVSIALDASVAVFQSLDWVDVDFDLGVDILVNQW